MRSPVKLEAGGTLDITNQCTKSTSYGTVTIAYVKVKGDVVQASFSITINQNVNAGSGHVSCFALPAKYRPSASFAGIGNTTGSAISMVYAEPSSYSTPGEVWLRPYNAGYTNGNTYNAMLTFHIM